MTELVSGMPAPQFGDESSLSVRIRAGSRFKRFLCFVWIDVRCFRVPQVQDHWSRQCGSPHVSKPHGPPRLVTGIALYLLIMIFCDVAQFSARLVGVTSQKDDSL
jgi:hypothetical protein